MPDEVAALWLVRHGQSVGNVANDEAHAAGRHRLDLADRDMDVALSDLGREQSLALGEWLREQPPHVQPEVVITSPYVRAAETARLIVETAELDVRIVHDERLREREFGILDLLTRRGIEATFPFEAERRARLGKFYYRPPGGESWVDVALRLRSFRDSIVRAYADRRVLVVAHEVPIILMRYLLEELDEKAALALSSSKTLATGSLTTYERQPDGTLRLDKEAWVAPLEREHTPVTDEPDAPIAPR